MAEPLLAIADLRAGYGSAVVLDAGFLIDDVTVESVLDEGFPALGPIAIHTRGVGFVIGKQDFAQRSVEIMLA